MEHHLKEFYKKKRRSFRNYKAVLLEELEKIVVSRKN